MQFLAILRKTKAVNVGGTGSVKKAAPGLAVWFSTKRFAYLYSAVNTDTGRRVLLRQERWA